MAVHARQRGAAGGVCEKRSAEPPPAKPRVDATAVRACEKGEQPPHANADSNAGNTVPVARVVVRAVVARCAITSPPAVARVVVGAVMARCAMAAPHAMPQVAAIDACEKSEQPQRHREAHPRRRRQRERAESAETPPLEAMPAPRSVSATLAVELCGSATAQA